MSSWFGLFFQGKAGPEIYCMNSTTKLTRSFFAKVPMGPPDAILGITEAFKADNFPQKINLGVGAYRDDNGKPFVLNAVKQVHPNYATANVILRPRRRSQRFTRTKSMQEFLVSQSLPRFLPLWHMDLARTSFQEYPVFN